MPGIGCWLLLITSIVPVEIVVQEHVDVIEFNHYRYVPGEPYQSQVIFWRWSRWDERYEVQAWRGVNEDTRLSLYDNRCVWRDGHGGGPYRDVRARIRVCETWTDYDPEAQNRTVVESDARRELRPSVKAAVKKLNSP